jgi:anti-sigma factor RsiW
MPADEKRRGDRELAELAALADGSLPPARREALERRIAASPRLQSLLREQKAALAAVRALEDRAPESLRESIAAGRTPRSRGLRPRVALGGLTVAGALAVLMLLVLPDSESTLPTLAQAASIAARPPTSAKPAVTAWGLEYPDLAGTAGWRAVGSRTDRIEGQTAKTVFYVNDRRNERQRIAYTILSGGRVRIAHGTDTWKRKGRPWYGFTDHGRAVVAWERKGHMCVVSASGLRGRGLVELITR